MLSNFIDDLRNTSKPSEKQKVVSKYDSDFLRHLIYSAYDPFKLFHIKLKKSEVPEPGGLDIADLEGEVMEVLEFCSTSQSPKQNRVKVLEVLAQLNGGSQDLLIGTLNKNWKAGLGAKTVHKLYPGLIHKFDVQLANTYDHERDYLIPRWIWSYKLDGLRCIALRESCGTAYDKGKWRLYSRKGKEFKTVDHLKDELEKLYHRLGWTFLDGELYKHGLPFEAIQGPIMGFKSTGLVPDMEYHVFVAGKAEKFLNGEDPNHVDTVGGKSEPFAPHIHFTSRGFITPVELEDKVEEAFELGYEGIMLRDPDHLYDYKRSNALLKLKRSLRADEEEMEIISDCIVTDIVYRENFPVIENGQMKFKKLLNKIWVLQEDGIECKVGSGFDLEFREVYTERPWELLGKKVEIKHQKWGKNGRMRFPRLYRVREDL